MMTANRSKKPARESRATGRAFLIESMALTVFLAMSLAVFVVLFSQAHNIADASAAQERAISAARDCAEVFSADPTSVPAVQTVEGLKVSCVTNATTQTSGTLYRAAITVTDEKGVRLYALDTARYVGGAQ